MPRILSILGALALVLATGCEKRVGADGKESLHFLGEPDPSKKWVAPDEITDFKKLFSQNCTGCHGFNNKPGGVIALDTPNLIRILSAEDLTGIISNGIKGTRMPAFGIASGGGLTDEQVKILVENLLEKKEALSSQKTLPLAPFHSSAIGNPEAGKAVYAASCATCHGPDGKGRISGSVVEPAYLGLISDQYLRSIAICGRPELGMPAPTIAGKPLTDQEVTDLVAWLASHRENEYGERLQAPAAEPSPAPKDVVRDAQQVP